MKLSQIVFGLLLVSASTVNAQLARVQVIHNCADAAAANVDVYLGSTLLIDNFAFRTASAFIDAPAGSEIVIGIALANSTNSSQAIATFPLTLTANAKYVVVANGIVSAGGYNPAPAFDLDIYALAREAATVGSNTDVLVAHGSTDAPTVDVIAPGAGTVVNDLAYGAFQGYLELPTANYTLNIAPAAGSPVVASFQAPLQTLNLQGKALVVVASGFLNPAVNANGPAFGLFAALPTGGALVALPSSTARVQVIHNSADAAASTVDVYLGNTLLIDNFAFRTASAFIDAPAETEINVGIALPNSTNSSQAIANFPITLAANTKYVVVANGIVSPTGYAPATAFGLNVYNNGREAATTGSNTDVLVAHGSTDAPTVDVIAPGAGTIVNDLAYGAFQGYLELPTANYTLNIAPAAGSPIVASFQAPLQTLNLQGKSLVVVASGFLNPAVNSNGPAFGLFAALPTGGALVALPASKARVQVIHNSADAAAASVDVYLGTTLLIDNFAFRTASPFIDAPAEIGVEIKIALANSTSSTDAIATFPATLTAGETYIIVADGIVSPTGYSPAKPFNLFIKSGAREVSLGNNVDILVHHGATDAPTVDVKEVAPFQFTVVNDISYGEFVGYGPIPPGNYQLAVQTADGLTTVVTYIANLLGLPNPAPALTILASGFLDPAVNSNGPAFGLYLATPAGGALTALPVVTGIEQVSPATNVVVYPNPAEDFIAVEYTLQNPEEIQIRLTDVSGKIVSTLNQGTVTGFQRQLIATSELSKGLYLLEVKSTLGSSFKKVSIR